MKSIIYDGNWTLNTTKKYKQSLFVFGDNKNRIGKKGQSVIRDSENSIGLVTKKSPNESRYAYFNDLELEENKKSIIEDILNIKKKSIDLNKTLVFSSGGYGNGLSKMSKMCPKTYEFLNDILKGNFGYDNKRGKLLNKIPGYNEIKKGKYIKLSKDNSSIFTSKNNSFYKKEYLENKLFSSYDLIISGKKIAFTHNIEIKLNPDDIIIFSFDNIVNYVVCRVSWSFNIDEMTKEQWSCYEGYDESYQPIIPEKYIQTHFQYVCILDSNNNMILPGDIFNNNLEIFKSDEDAKIFFDNIINPKEPNENLKKAFKDYKDFKNSEKSEIENIINEKLEDFKKDLVTKKEINEYFDTLLTELKRDKGSFWSRLFK
jgi:hypothetical protein